MPISDELLQKDKNRFIAVKGEATVGQAIAAWQNLEGQHWWHLIVRLPDGSWGAARFSKLASLGDATGVSEIQLRAWPDLTVTSAVECDSMDTRTAQALARKSPASLLVVTVNNVPVGIVVEGVTRGSGALSLTSEKLDSLGGKYVKLSDYGAILLGSSKRTAGTVKLRNT